eukprot:Gb_20688 [translate_table: standard]
MFSYLCLNLREHFSPFCYIRVFPPPNTFCFVQVQQEVLIIRDIDILLHRYGI